MSKREQIVSGRTLPVSAVLLGIRESRSKHAPLGQVLGTVYALTPPVVARLRKLEPSEAEIFRQTRHSTALKLHRGATP